MEAINIELNREGLIKFREAGKEKKKRKKLGISGSRKCLEEITEE